MAKNLLSFTIKWDRVLSLVQEDLKSHPLRNNKWTLDDALTINETATDGMVKKQAERVASVEGKILEKQKKLLPILQEMKDLVCDWVIHEQVLIELREMSDLQFDDRIRTRRQRKVNKKKEIIEKKRKSLEDQLTVLERQTGNNRREIEDLDEEEEERRYFYSREKFLHDNRSKIIDDEAEEVDENEDEDYDQRQETKSRLSKQETKLYSVSNTMAKKENRGQTQKHEAKKLINPVQL